MCEDDFDEFVALLDDSYVFQREKLSVDAKTVFFRAMAAFPLEVVRAAMSAHMLDPKVGKFAMQPADLIAKIEAAAAKDNRPGAEEAWAIALTSRDEAETVVWTSECAEAFAVCQPVLDIGDDVGARMAFKEAYLRIVALARAARLPVEWFPSLGWDTTKRTAALTASVSAGLLASSAVAALLPPPAGAPRSDTNAHEQIEKIKTMLATMNAEKQLESELHRQRERDATAAAKARANALTANYRKDEAA